MAILISVFIGMITLFIHIGNSPKPKCNSRESPAYDKLIETVEKEDRPVSKAHRLSDPISSPPLDIQDKRAKLRKCLEYLKEREIQDLPVGDEPKEGMIKLKKVFEVASQHARNTSNTNQAPSVVLIGDFYIATYEKYKNPFRTGKPHFDCRIGIDAWTGEYISLLRSGGGIIVLKIDKKTGAGLIGEEPEAEAYKSRLFDRLKELGMRVFYGRPWNSETKLNMITSKEAVRIAQEQVSDRDFDQNKEPWPILVDDVYIVTFWKKEIEKLPNGSPAYDMHVGIDAYSGEFVAMEITR